MNLVQVNKVNLIKLFELCKGAKLQTLERWTNYKEKYKEEEEEAVEKFYTFYLVIEHFLPPLILHPCRPSPIAREKFN